METKYLLNVLSLALAWIVPLAVCYFAWPWLRQKRAYIVAAAVLCLTPLFAHYPFMSGFFATLPLILALPASIALLPQSLELLLFMGAPSAILIGGVTWFVAGHLVHPTDS